MIKNYINIVLSFLVGSIIISSIVLITIYDNKKPEHVCEFEPLISKIIKVGDVVIKTDSNGVLIDIEQLNSKVVTKTMIKHYAK